MRAIRDAQALLDLVVTATDQLVDLTEQHLRIDDHALRQHAARLGAQDAARKEAHHQLVVANHEGVTGIGAAGVADHDLGELRVDIDDLAFAFVAPLGAHDHDTRHADTASSVWD